MSNIKKLETILDLEQFLTHDADKTLLLFDVGDVLLVPEGALLQGEVKKMREQLRAEHLSPLGDERHKHLWSQILINEKRQLVEAHTPKIIKDLQEKGVKIMALTALQTGQLGAIESMEDWRLAHLARHGIHFTPVAQNQEHFVLDELYQDGFSPVYKKGALFTYKQSKGQVLTAFLNRINWMPQHIVFVDDKRANIEDVAEASDKLAIPFTGAHYQVAKNLAKRLDKQLADFRFKHLVEHGIWLDEDEALALMKG